MEASCRFEADNITPGYVDVVEKCVFNTLHEISPLLSQNDPATRPILDFMKDLNKNESSNEAYEYYLKTEILRDKIEAAFLSGLAEKRK
jgi:hypothetical protein